MNILVTNLLRILMMKNASVTLNRVLWPKRKNLQKPGAKTSTRSKPYQTRRNFDAGSSSSTSRSSDLFRGYNSQYRQASGFVVGRFGMGFGQSKFKASSPIFVSNMAGKVTGGENVKQPNNQSRPKMAAPRAASGISGEGKQKIFTSNDII